MQKKIYKEDNGVNFGKWNDPVSKFLYTESTIDILSKIKLPKKIGDFGGANGILKKIIPGVITVDIDETKNPDIIDDITEHSDFYNLVIIRYVLHYLDDYSIIKLFKNINAENILIIQFVNENLIYKYENSINEYKYYRTKEQLYRLIPEGKIIYEKEYIVDEQFYKNRLGKGEYKAHEETLIAYYI